MRRCGAPGSCTRKCLNEGGRTPLGGCSPVAFLLPGSLPWPLVPARCPAGSGPLTWRRSTRDSPQPSTGLPPLTRRRCIFVTIPAAPPPPCPGTLFFLRITRPFPHPPCLLRAASKRGAPASASEALAKMPPSSILRELRRTAAGNGAGPRPEGRSHPLHVRYFPLPASKGCTL